MIDNFLTIAADIKRKSQVNPFAAAELLIGLTREYKVENSLSDESIYLKMQLSDVYEPDKLLVISKQLEQLTDKVVDDINKRDEDEWDRVSLRKIALDQYTNRVIAKKTVLESKNISYEFNDKKFKLNSVSLCLEEGQITGVVGENATGKTTLFRVLIGELLNMTGTLRYPSLNIESDAATNWFEVKKKIGYVPQSLEPWRGSLKSNLKYSASVKGIKGAANEKEVTYIIERLGLRKYLDHDWEDLSGGIKLRFQLAYTLVWKPKLLVLDEPLANLDYKSQLTLLKDIKDLSASLVEPMAVLISSQHLHEIEAVADRILFLDQGNVVYNGNTKDVGKDRIFNMYEITTDLSLIHI